jgi:signal transduction histidine kinase
VLTAGEVIAGPVVLIAVFFGALFIGLQASRPVEQARRRQLEFTADASHELRTPLSVIEAEVSLALRTPRDAARYRDTLERVSAESRRLHSIVDDLLWLARFDSQPTPPRSEPVDLHMVAYSCANRFGAVAQARDTSLLVEARGNVVPTINAPPEWVDRLCGVLVDNALRYARDNGVVRIVVTTQGNRVAVAVEDDGPGIPPEERPQLFDRFHRATGEGSGTGLGLAIADSIVHSTGGRWRIADSVLGGAYMEVSWHRAHARADPPSAGSINSPASGVPAGEQPVSAPSPIPG